MNAQNFGSTLIKADLFDLLDLLEDVSEEIVEKDDEFDRIDTSLNQDSHSNTNKFISRNIQDFNPDNYSLPEEDLDYLVGKITNLICKIEDLDMYDTFLKD